MKIRKRKSLVIVILLLLATSVAYYLYINRNSARMTGKQKVLKAVYPIVTSVSRMFRKNGAILANMKKAQPSQPIYDLSVKLNTGNELSLRELAGKKILLVNTASDCGFTGQYEELQELQNRYNGKLQVIGFPANDFKQQEKGTDAEILQFCKLNYGISFPLVVKSVVIKNEQQHPVFRWLTDPSLNGWNEKAPSWNFSKYLIDENGVLTNYFEPTVSPLDAEVTEALNFVE